MNQKEADAMMETYASQFDEEKEDLQWMEEMRAAKEQRRRLSEIARHLNLPCTRAAISNDPMIYMKDLWNILSDEKKLKEFLSRLNNKAFW